MKLALSKRRSVWRIRALRLGVPLSPDQDPVASDARLGRSAILLFIISAALVFTAGAYTQIRVDAGFGLAFTEIVLIGLPAYLFLWQAPVLVNSCTFSRPRARRFLRLALVAACASVGATALGTIVRRALGLSAESLAIDLTITPLSIVTLMFSLVVLAPLCEELLFRVAIQGAFARTLSPATAVVGASALFAVYHGALERVPEVLVLGLMLGTLYRRTGNYWQCVFVHVVLNTLGPPLFVTQSALPTAVLIGLSAILVPLAMVALPRASDAHAPRVSSDKAGSAIAPGQRGVLVAITLLVIGGLGIEAALHATGALARLEHAQFPPPGWCRQEWRLQAAGPFRVTERLTLAPGQSPPEHIASIAEGAALLSAVVDSAPRAASRRANEAGWSLESGPPDGARRLVLVWSVPVESLQADSGIYWVRTRTVVPVSGLRVDLVLEPGCGYDDAREPARRDDPVLRMNTGSDECFKTLPRVGFQLRPSAGRGT